MREYITSIMSKGLVTNSGNDRLQKGTKHRRHACCSHGSNPAMDQPRPQGFSLKKWVGREKALASAGHVHSLNIPEKLIYMQPAGFALTEVERSNNGK